MKSQLTWFAAGLAAMAGAFLLLGGGLASTLPLLVLLACPLMMVFMMRGMGGHGADHGATRRREHDDSRTGR